MATLTRESAVLFTHLVFLPEGLAFTSPSAGVIAQELWPNDADALWDDDDYKLAVVENFKIAPNTSEAVVKTGIPGALADKRVHEVGREIKMTFDGVEVTSRAMGLVFGGWIAAQPQNAILPATTSFTPQKGKQIVHGILNYQSYDEDHTKRESGSIYGALKVTNLEPWSGANIWKATFDFRMLWSSLNTISRS